VVATSSRRSRSRRRLRPWGVSVLAGPPLLPPIGCPPVRDAAPGRVGDAGAVELGAPAVWLRDGVLDVRLFPVDEPEEFDGGTLPATGADPAPEPMFGMPSGSAMSGTGGRLTEGIGGGVGAPSGATPATPTLGAVRNSAVAPTIVHDFRIASSVLAGKKYPIGDHRTQRAVISANVLEWTKSRPRVRPTPLGSSPRVRHGWRRGYSTSRGSQAA
jgi:hypothetical protein